MFEALAAWVLNSYIGDYLENLNTDQLSLYLFQGQLELDNVPFKQSALKKFGVPINIRSGIIGKLVLTVPLTRFRSESWTISLSDIYVVLERDSSSNCKSHEDQNYSADGADADVEFSLANDIKTVDRPSTSETAPQNSNSWWDYYGASSIINNITLIIKNACIRYEHESLDPANSFAFGMKIDNLSIKSTNANWSPTFVYRNPGDNNFKLLNIDGLSVYWDCKGKFFRAESYCSVIALHHRFEHKSSQIDSDYEFVEISTKVGPTKLRPPIPSVQSTSSSHWLVYDAHSTVNLQIKSATPKNPSASALFDFSVKIDRFLRLCLDQSQLNSIKCICSSLSDDYELEFDRNADKNSHARVRRKESDSSKNQYGVQILASFEIDQFSIVLRNTAPSSDSADTPFVCCRADSTLVRYISDEPSLNCLELSSGSLWITDLLHKSNVHSVASSTLFHAKSKRFRHSSQSRPILSSSCPDLNEWSLPGKNSPLSSSLQNNGINQSVCSTSSASLSSFSKFHKKRGRNFGEPAIAIKVTLVDPNHADFAKVYTEASCNINVDGDIFDFGFDQETWLILLDFFGFLSHKTPEEIENNSSSKTRLHINAKHASMVMKVLDRSQLLAKIKCNSLKMSILNEHIGLTIDGKISELHLEDLTLVQSHLYKEKLSIPSDGRDLEFLLFKYGEEDPTLKRDCDAVLSLISPCKLCYVHGHKFINEFIAYWVQFSQCYNYFAESNDIKNGRVFHLENRSTHGFRLKLTCELNRPKIVVPESSSNCRALLVSCEKMTIDNYFRLASSRETAKFYENSHDDFDCLQDVMEVKLNQCQLKVVNVVACEKSHRKIIILTPNLFNRVYDLNLTVVRNLDSNLSRYVPDVEIRTNLENVACSLLCDSYDLLKNILHGNVGEADNQIVDSSRNFIGISQTTNAYVETWTSFLLIIDFKNVVLHVYAKAKKFGDEPNENSGQESKFGRVILEEANFSLECFSNHSKSVEFICYSASLVDSRYEDLPANKRGNVFPEIFSTNRCSEKNWPTENDANLHPASFYVPGDKNNASANKPISAEIYFISSLRDASKFSVIVTSGRLILITDWLSTARDFITSSGSSSDVGATVPYSQTFDVKSGVAVRRRTQEKISDNYEFKINLSQCELIFVENASCRHSLATILRGSSIVYYPCVEGSAPSFSCDAVQISNCTMENMADTETVITEPFSLTVEPSREETASSKSAVNFKFLPVGLIEVASSKNDRKTEVNLCDFVAKMSYRDWLVCTSVLDSYLQGDVTVEIDETLNLASSKSLQRQKSMFGKFCAKIMSFSLLLLDDSHDHRLPLLKFTAKNSEFEQKICGVGEESVNYSGQTSVSVDFFNQNLYGWEPLIEPWKIENFSLICTSKQNQYSLSIGSMHQNLNVNISRIFLDQLSQFWTQWPVVSKTMSSDFRTSYQRKSDFLPYVMKNETGVNLWFCVENESESKNSKPKDWMPVENGKSRSFSFQSFRSMRWNSSNFDDYSSLLVSNKVTLKIDGWHEISAINVDSVGTFFRLTRLNSKHTRTSYLHPVPVHSSYAQIVIHITKDNEGRKILTARSSFLFVNALPDPVEVCLENMSTFIGDVHTLIIQPGEFSPAPLNYTMCRIFARPRNSCISAEYCKVINWQHVNIPGMVAECVRNCSIQNKSVPYQMCLSIKREHFPESKRYPDLQDSNIVTLPGHTVTFGAPLTIKNLLPNDVHIISTNGDFSEIVNSGNKKLITTIDILKDVELGISTDNFELQETLKFNSTSLTKNDHTLCMEMMDSMKRTFLLSVVLGPSKGGGVKVTLSSPFWIVNKSGLPLIFKQEGSREESAGQCKEHECAKSMNPMVFSFSDYEAPLQLCLRMGNNFIAGYHPLWCHSFVLEPGITRKTLHMESTQGKPPMVYNIGVEVRNGHGVHKDTKIVMLTPLYTLNNRSSFDLFVAQHCDINNDGPTALHRVASNSFMAWHWSRQDLDMLLCVKRVDLFYWSSGFYIDRLTSFHLTMRDRREQPHFLRVEIVLHGATYFVTFLDADTFPPPMRIENRSDVPILYKQKGCAESYLHTILSPRTEVNYSWDNQLKPNTIILTVQSGSKSMEYDLFSLGQQHPLIYENYFYIAFAHTFDHSSSEISPENCELVLDVLDKGKVILNKKDTSKRSQLWRMTPEGLLANMGCQKTDRTDENQTLVLDILSFCDPKTQVPLMLLRMDQRRRLTQRWSFTDGGRLICGLQGMCVQSGDKTPRCGSSAVLGSMSVDRAIRSESAHYSATVPSNGELSVKQRNFDDRALPALNPLTDFDGSDGRTVAEPSRDRRSSARCTVVRQRQKAGSGTLSVAVLLDGPTRVLRIADLLAGSVMDSSRFYLNSAIVPRPPTHVEPSNGVKSLLMERRRADLGVKLHFTLHLEALAFSIITQDYEELAYCQMRGFTMAAGKMNVKYSLSISVLDFQADNQLTNFDRWHFLYVRPKYDEKGDCVSEAFRVNVQWTPLPLYDNFESFVISIGETALYVEEVFLWKLVKFLQLSADDESNFSAGKTKITAADSNFKLPDLDVETMADPKKARRCYFGHLSLSCRRLYLSVMTAPGGFLPDDLRCVKQRWNVPLVRFENASVDVAPFRQMYCFETVNFLSDAVCKHLQQQLTSQAVKILGSVDFLGNPIGLFQDVSGGLCELIVEGNVTNFVRGVWHGVSNSTAKITSSVSEGVGKMSMDDNHRRVREQHYYGTGSSGGSPWTTSSTYTATGSGAGGAPGADPLSHLMTGVKGLGIGIWGGAISLPSNIYDGGKKDGLGGFVIGAGKGIVGTVTKPVQGLLDFVTGAAIASKEAIGGPQQSSRFSAQRLRAPRVTKSVQGTLPTYSLALAKGQEVLRAISSNAKDKICMAMHQISEASNGETLHALVSNTKVYFVKKRRASSDDYEVVFKAKYSELSCCSAVRHRRTADVVAVDGKGLPASSVVDESPRIELALISPSGGTRKSLVKCSSLDTASKVCRIITFAKEQFDNKQRCLPIEEDVSTNY